MADPENVQLRNDYLSLRQNFVQLKNLYIRLPNGNVTTFDAEKKYILNAAAADYNDQDTLYFGDGKTIISVPTSFPNPDDPDTTLEGYCLSVYNISDRLTSGNCTTIDVTDEGKSLVNIEYNNTLNIVENEQNKPQLTVWNLHSRIRTHRGIVTNDPRNRTDYPDEYNTLNVNDVPITDFSINHDPDTLSSIYETNGSIIGVKNISPRIKEGQWMDITTGCTTNGDLHNPVAVHDLDIAVISSVLTGDNRTIKIHTGTVTTGDTFERNKPCGLIEVNPGLRKGMLLSTIMQNVPGVGDVLSAVWVDNPGYVTDDQLLDEAVYITGVTRNNKTYEYLPASGSSESGYYHNGKYDYEKLTISTTDPLNNLKQADRYLKLTFIKQHLSGGTPPPFDVEQVDVMEPIYIDVTELFRDTKQGENVYITHNNFVHAVDTTYSDSGISSLVFEDITDPYNGAYSQWDDVDHLSTKFDLYPHKTIRVNVNWLSTAPSAGYKAIRAALTGILGVESGTNNYNGFKTTKSANSSMVLTRSGNYYHYGVNNTWLSANTDYDGYNSIRAALTSLLSATSGYEKLSGFQTSATCESSLVLTHNGDTYHYGVNDVWISGGTGYNGYLDVRAALTGLLGTTSANTSFSGFDTTYYVNSSIILTHDSTGKYYHLQVNDTWLSGDATSGGLAFGGYKDIRAALTSILSTTSADVKWDGFNVTTDDKIHSSMVLINKGSDFYYGVNNTWLTGGTEYNGYNDIRTALTSLLSATSGYEHLSGFQTLDPAQSSLVLTHNGDKYHYGVNDIWITGGMSYIGYKDIRAVLTSLLGTTSSNTDYDGFDTDLEINSSLILTNDGNDYHYQVNDIWLSGGTGYSGYNDIRAALTSLLSGTSGYIGLSGFQTSDDSESSLVLTHDGDKYHFGVNDIWITGGMHYNGYNDIRQVVIDLLSSSYNDTTYKGFDSDSLDLVEVIDEDTDEVLGYQYQINTGWLTGTVSDSTEHFTVDDDTIQTYGSGSAAEPYILNIKSLSGRVVETNAISITTQNVFDTTTTPQTFLYQNIVLSAKPNWISSYAQDGYSAVRKALTALLSGAQSGNLSGLSSNSLTLSALYDSENNITGYTYVVDPEWISQTISDAATFVADENTIHLQALENGGQFSISSLQNRLAEGHATIITHAQGTGDFKVTTITSPSAGYGIILNNYKNGSTITGYSYRAPSGTNSIALNTLKNGDTITGYSYSVIPGWISSHTLDGYKAVRAALTSLLSSSYSNTNLSGFDSDSMQLVKVYDTTTPSNPVFKGFEYKVNDTWITGGTSHQGYSDLRIALTSLLSANADVNNLSGFGSESLTLSELTGKNAANQTVVTGYSYGVNPDWLGGQLAAGATYVADGDTLHLEQVLNETTNITEKQFSIKNLSARLTEGVGIVYDWGTGTAAKTTINAPKAGSGLTLNEQADTNVAGRISSHTYDVNTDGNTTTISGNNVIVRSISGRLAEGTNIVLSTATSDPWKTTINAPSAGYGIYLNTYKNGSIITGYSYQAPSGTDSIALNTLKNGSTITGYSYQVSDTWLTGYNHQGYKDLRNALTSLLSGTQAGNLSGFVSDSLTLETLYDKKNTTDTTKWVITGYTYKVNPDWVQGQVADGATYTADEDTLTILNKEFYIRSLQNRLVAEKGIVLKQAAASKTVGEKTYTFYTTSVKAPSGSDSISLNEFKDGNKITGYTYSVVPGWLSGQGTKGVSGGFKTIVEGDLSSLISTAPTVTTGLSLAISSRLSANATTVGTVITGYNLYINPSWISTSTSGGYQLVSGVAAEYLSSQAGINELCTIISGKNGVSVTTALVSNKPRVLLSATADEKTITTTGGYISSLLSTTGKHLGLNNDRNIISTNITGDDTTIKLYDNGTISSMLSTDNKYLFLNDDRNIISTNLHGDDTTVFIDTDGKIYCTIDPNDGADGDTTYVPGDKSLTFTYPTNSTLYDVVTAVVEKNWISGQGTKGLSGGFKTLIQGTISSIITGTNSLTAVPRLSANATTVGTVITGYNLSVNTGWLKDNYVAHLSASKNTDNTNTTLNLYENDVTRDSVYISGVGGVHVSGSVDRKIIISGDNTTYTSGRFTTIDSANYNAINNNLSGDNYITYISANTNSTSGIFKLSAGTNDVNKILSSNSTGSATWVTRPTEWVNTHNTAYIKVNADGASGTSTTETIPSLNAGDPVSLAIIDGEVRTSKVNLTGENIDITFDGTTSTLTLSATRGALYNLSANTADWDVGSYIQLYKDNTLSDQIQFSGGGATHIKSEDGVITISTKLDDPGSVNYVTHIYAGDATEDEGNTNAATTNGNTYIKIYDDDIFRNKLGISGTNGINVSTNTSGHITLSGTLTSGRFTTINSNAITNNLSGDGTVVHISADTTTTSGKILLSSAEGGKILSTNSTGTASWVNAPTDWKNEVSYLRVNKDGADDTYNNVNVSTTITDTTSLALVDGTTRTSKINLSGTNINFAFNATTCTLTLSSSEGALYYADNGTGEPSTLTLDTTNKKFSAYDLHTRLSGGEGIKLEVDTNKITDIINTEPNWKNDIINTSVTAQHNHRYLVNQATNSTTPLNITLPTNPNNNDRVSVFVLSIGPGLVYILNPDKEMDFSANGVTRIVPALNDTTAPAADREGFQIHLSLVYVELVFKKDTTTPANSRWHLNLLTNIGAGGKYFPGRHIGIDTNSNNINCLLSGTSPITIDNDHYISITKGAQNQVLRTLRNTTTNELYVGWGAGGVDGGTDDYVYKYTSGTEGSLIFGSNDASLFTSTITENPISVNTEWLTGQVNTYILGRDGSGTDKNNTLKRVKEGGVWKLKWAEDLNDGSDSPLPQWIDVDFNGDTNTKETLDVYRRGWIYTSSLTGTSYQKAIKTINLSRSADTYGYGRMKVITFNRPVTLSASKMSTKQPPICYISPIAEGDDAISSVTSAYTYTTPPFSQTRLFYLDDPDNLRRDAWMALNDRYRLSAGWGISLNYATSSNIVTINNSSSNYCNMYVGVVTGTALADNMHHDVTNVNGSGTIKLYDNGINRQNIWISGAGDTEVYTLTTKFSQTSPISGVLQISSVVHDPRIYTGTIGSTNGPKNTATTTNGSGFIKVYDNGTLKDNIRLSGTEDITVTTATSGSNNNTSGIIKVGINYPGNCVAVISGGHIVSAIPLAPTNQGLVFLAFRPNADQTENPGGTYEWIPAGNCDT